MIKLEKYGYDYHEDFKQFVWKYKCLLPVSDDDGLFNNNNNSTSSSDNSSGSNNNNNSDNTTTTTNITNNNSDNNITNNNTQQVETITKQTAAIDKEITANILNFLSTQMILPIDSWHLGTTQIFLKLYSYKLKLDNLRYSIILKYIIKIQKLVCGYLVRNQIRKEKIIKFQKLKKNKIIQKCIRNFWTALN